MRRLDNIDLRLLRVFVVLADAGGFAQAQITLNLSQSTLSTHLAELEKRIGGQLCLRGRNRFRRTGLVLYSATVPPRPSKARETGRLNRLFWPSL